jgi:hypothetical protein
VKLDHLAVQVEVQEALLSTVQIEMPQPVIRDLLVD